MSDDFGRPRLLLLDETPDGAPNSSWDRLRREVPRAREERVPYTEGDPSSDGVRGVVWFALPAHRRAHWLETAEALRGQWVTVEATVRPYVVRRDGREISGVSLDIAMISPVAMLSPLAAPQRRQRPGGGHHI